VAPAAAPQAAPARRADGLPEGLQTAMEAMSGFSLADVVVHRNSAEPTRLGAAAFAKGNEIHVAPGEERHLPHEAWHVVQQAQGRVRPTMQLNGGIPANGEPALEREADRMGARAIQAPTGRAGANALGSLGRHEARPEVEERPEAAIAGDPGRVVQGVLLGGTDYKSTDANGAKHQSDLQDALEAIIGAQVDDPTDLTSWVAKVNLINEQLRLDWAANATPSATSLAAIKSFYVEVAELNFIVNPVLREAWQRCLDATADWKTYSKVGGKFKEMFADVLGEIEADFPALSSTVKKIKPFGVNKEHIINKGVMHGGEQTEHLNLMHAGLPPAGTKQSLSLFHIGLHGMKSGTGSTDFNALHPDIRDVQEEVLSSPDYAKNVMSDIGT
jgi:hypothetical protein